MNESGYYLKQSTNFQYGAIACASIAASMFLIGNSRDNDTTRYNLNVFGYVCAGNKAIMKKITDLLKDISEHPYTGIGKPEPLKYELAGYWSRRINSEHRIIYSVHDDIVTVYVLSMRYHYTK